MQQAVLAVAAVLVACAGALPARIAYTGNISDVDAHADARYRAGGLNTFSAGTIFTGALFYTLNAEAEAALIHSHAEAAAAGNGSFAVAGVVPGTVPAAIYGYFLASADAGIGKSSIANVDFSAAAGVLGMAFPAINEVDASGKIVKRIPLVSTVVSVGTLGMTYTQLTTSAADGLYVYAVQGKSSAITFNLTFTMSSNPGLINYASTVVLPQVLEIVFETADYQYQTAGNKLSLVVITASAAAQIDAGAVVTSGNASCWADMKAAAEIDGADGQPVAFAGWALNASASADYPDLFKTLLSQALPKGTSASFHQTAVTFPAGAKTIVWDPALGHGTSPYKMSAAHGAAPAPAAALALLAAALLARLF